MRILVFQHVPVEHPGVFRELWDAAGHTWHPIELDHGEAIPPLEGFDLMVSMGGPMDVWQTAEHPWIAPEIAAIRRWVADLQRPFLGICLGHQLLAKALGGQVTPMRTPEVGLAPVHLTPAGRIDPLLMAFPEVVETFQWHGAEVSALPPDTEILAGNAHCSVQAMRCGKRAWGFQYHVEITSTTVADWEAIPAYKASLEQALGPVAARGLGESVAPRLPAFRRSAKRLNDNLMALLAAGRPEQKR